MTESTTSTGWRKENKHHSLSEAFSSIPIPKKGGFWKKFFAFSGPGLLIAVGYMDPGNWATDIAGGAQFGYTLLSVILISNLFAILLQHLAIKLGVVAERDLAQACRDHYSPALNFILWILCEIAIAACDLAEVIGSALALNLLFGLPMAWGVAITALDVLIILFFQYKGFRYIEALVAALIFTISICFGFEIVSSQPDIPSLLKGLIPKPEIITDPRVLYLAIGILGATVMPHNLYLHSSLIQTRNYPRNIKGKKMAIKYATIDSTWSLSLAFFINAAILIVSAETFHKTGYIGVTDITEAHELLSPLMGSTLASVLFAIALLASGQNSTLTGTIAGQIVMEGFLNIRLKPWLRRLITRFIAIVPAMAVVIIYGEKGATELLVISQVILSLQLSFAIVPLINFTNDRQKMGGFANGFYLKCITWTIAIVIITLNVFLLYDTILK